MKVKKIKNKAFHSGTHRIHSGPNKGKTTEQLRVTVNWTMFKTNEKVQKKRRQYQHLAMKPPVSDRRETLSGNRPLSET